MKEIITSSQLKEVSGGKGLIQAIVGAVIGKKLIADIQKNLQPKPKVITAKPVKKV